jgi:sugar lactone lactonase YvrE
MSYPIFTFGKRLLVVCFLPCVFSVKGMAQVITTFAGAGTANYSGDGGLAIAAELKTPGHIAFDRVGNLYICDAGNRRIRRINSAGVITTVAGNGTSTQSGDGGPATSAGIGIPTGIAVDTFGNLYFSTVYGADHRIRKINTSGIISTIAGDGTSGYNGDGIPATAAKLFYPYVGGIDNAGNLYFSDYNNHRVRKIDPSGIITTIAGDGTNGDSGDGGAATSAQLKGPGYLALLSSGDIYIPDNTAHRIRKVSGATGVITTIAGDGTMGYSGDGGLASAAQLSYVNCITFDKAGSAYIADYDKNVIRKIDPLGVITSVVGTGVAGYSGDGGPAISAKLDGPNAVVANNVGNIFIADNNNHRIRKVAFYPYAINDIHAIALNIGLFPNPTQETITISAANRIGDIAISNSLGQLVHTTQSNEKQVSLQIAHLPAGLYMVKVNGIYAGKFIKE